MFCFYISINQLTKGLLVGIFAKTLVVYGIQVEVAKVAA